MYCTIDLVAVYDAILTSGILGDPGAVSRVGRKGGTNVFKYGRGLKIGMGFRDLAPIVQKLDVQGRNEQFWDVVLEEIM